MTSSTLTRGSTYSLLADLPLLVNGYRLAGLAKPWSSSFTRRSTVVHLFGGQEEGVGEDVTYTPDDHELFQRQGGHLPLAGAFTLREFSELLDEYDLFSRPPERDDSRAHRRWAFESAALDLALRQSRLSLADALRLSPKPVEFVVSFRLDDDAPSIDPVAQRLALYPSMRFKIDTSSSWSTELIAELEATGAVASVDFKGHYEGLPVAISVDAEIYARVITGLPSLARKSRADRGNRVASWFLVGPSDVGCPDSLGRRYHLARTQASDDQRQAVPLWPAGSTARRLRPSRLRRNRRLWLRPIRARPRSRADSVFGLALSSHRPKRCCSCRPP